MSNKAASRREFLVAASAIGMGAALGCRAEGTSEAEGAGDAASKGDTGSAGDAGRTGDAGIAGDTGIASDAGATSDARATSDTGSTSDTSTSETGSPSEAAGPPVALTGRVVHVHDTGATSWNFTSGWYGSFVNAAVVQTMFETALTQLTGAASAAAAWAVLLPAYKAGQTFAIKVNFNNYTGTDPDPNIDALIEPVNAVIQTLLDFGVPGANICVYDVTNAEHQGQMPKAPFINRCVNSAVRFYAYMGNPTPFSATESATFPAAIGVSPRALAQCLVESDYLISMPIPKAHVGTTVTCGLKLHFGSIDGNDALHNSANPTSNPNAQVELFKNKNLSGKHVLTVADLLYGNWQQLSGAPPKWTLYGNTAANGLVVSADPIAIDCVLTDILSAENALHGGAFASSTWAPLQLAAADGLGTYEKGDPTKTPVGSGYSTIRYIYVDGA